MEGAGSAAELQSHVSDYIQSPTGPLPVKEAPGGATTNVTALTAALAAIVARLTTRTITVEHIAGIH